MNALSIVTLAFLGQSNISDAEMCSAFAAIAANGAEDGQVMASIPDGLTETFTASEVSTDAEARAVASTYLSGYANGLLGEDPSLAAIQFLAGCMSEGA